MKMPLRITGLALAAVLALAACGTTRDDPAPTEEPQSSGEEAIFKPGTYRQETPAEPQSGGTLTMAENFESRTLDPVMAFIYGGSGGSQLLAIYDSLIRYNAETEAYEPQLAETVEPSEDFTTWTITLREDLTFSDGTPLDADAVVASVNRYVQNGGTNMAAIGPFWKGISKVDDRTVQFELTESWASFDSLLGQGMGMIVSPTADEGGEFSPIGAGPFMFESYAPSEELVLASNPNYWQGEPYLDKLRFVWLGADETKVDSFRTGSVQTAYLRQAPIIHELRTNETPGNLVLDSLGDTIFFNDADGRPATNDKVRKAMYLALDPEAIYERVHDGIGLPTKSIFGPMSRWHVDGEPDPYDPEQATQLLEEAKAEGFDGEIAMLFNGSDPASRESTMSIAGQLEAVGFTVNMDSVRSPADLTQKFKIDRNFDFAKAATSVGEPNPFPSIFAEMHSESRGNTNVNHPDLDALIDELRVTPAEDMPDVVERLEAAFQEHVPFIGLGSAVTFTAWQDNVHGVIGTNEGMISYEKAWLE